MVKDLHHFPCVRRRTRIIDFDGERGRDNGHLESGAGVSPGHAHSQDPLGRREPGPATATGGLQAIRQTPEVATTRSRLLGMAFEALAELALRYDCPVVPARITRLKGARFRLTVLAPLELIRTGDHKADVAANMAQVNALMEQWVRDTPEQWLWLHNRWPDA